MGADKSGPAGNNHSQSVTFPFKKRSYEHNCIIFPLLFCIILLGQSPKLQTLETKFDDLEVKNEEKNI